MLKFFFQYSVVIKVGNSGVYYLDSNASSATYSTMS